MSDYHVLKGLHLARYNLRKIQKERYKDADSQWKQLKWREYERAIMVLDELMSKERLRLNEERRKENTNERNNDIQSNT